MRYEELERYACWTSGIASAAVVTAVEILMKMDVIGIIFSIGCMLIIGAGVFLHVSDIITAHRRKITQRRRRRKSVDYRVGRQIPGMPGYVEVRS